MANAADRTCPKCDRVFTAPCRLRSHQNRKTPCEPIVAAAAKKPSEPQCRYCGRAFASTPSLNRHIRQSCKIANGEGGIEKLIAHTLCRQRVEENARFALLEAQVASLLRDKPAAAVTNYVTASATINIQQNIILNAWDGGRRISVDIDQILAAFSQNPRLQEYSRLGDHGMADPAVAPPYVTDLLMDLVRRAHAAPEARNIYLNPKRADQALVHMSGGRWEVVTLSEATRLLFDGVVVSIHQVSKALKDLKRLPLEAQSALGVAGMMYGDEPEEYVKRARGPMAAHLTNCGAVVAEPPAGPPVLPAAEAE